MNRITYDERVSTYTNALIGFGMRNQMVVALEELSECQKEALGAGNIGVVFRKS